MREARLLHAGEISCRPNASRDLIVHRQVEKILEALRSLVERLIEQHKSIWIECQKSHWL
jgi:predicted molibdopterin-dependent oxidoreductase YjgC